MKCVYTGCGDWRGQLIAKPPFCTVLEYCTVSTVHYSQYYVFLLRSFARTKGRNTRPPIQLPCKMYRGVFHVSLRSLWFRVDTAWCRPERCSTHATRVRVRDGRSCVCMGLSCVTASQNWSFSLLLCFVFDAMPHPLYCGCRSWEGR